MSLLDQGLEHPTLSVSPTLLSDSLCMLASAPPTTCELSPCLRKHGHQQLWAKCHSKVMIQKAKVSLEYQQSWKDSNWPSLDYLLTLGSIIVTTSMMMYKASAGRQGFRKHIIVKREKQVFPEIGVLGGPKEIHCSPEKQIGYSHAKMETRVIPSREFEQRLEDG